MLIYFNWNKNQNTDQYHNKTMVFEIIIYDNVKFINFNNYLVAKSNHINDDIIYDYEENESKT